MKEKSVLEVPVILTLASQDVIVEEAFTGVDYNPGG